MDRSKQEPDNNRVKKTSSYEEAKTTEASSNNSSRLSKFKGKRSKLIVLCIVLTVGIVGFVAYSLVNKSREDKDPVVFSIDDRKFRTSEVNPFIDLASQYGVDDKKAKNAVIEAMKLKIATNKLNIEVSDKAIRDALQTTSYAKIAKATEPLDKWVELIGYRLATENIQKSQAKVAKQGYAFVFYFGNLIIPNEPADSNFSGFGSQTLIDKDKEYAIKKAEEYHKNLTEGKITPDQALEQLRADKQLNFGYLANSSYSIKFGTGNDPSVTWQNEVRLQDIVNHINKETKVKEFSEVKSGTLSINPSSSETKEAYRFFTYLTSSGDKIGLLDGEVAKMKVVTND